MLSIVRESPDQPDVIHLLQLADERSSRLYPAESRHGASVAALLAQEVRFFVARLDGLTVGCGGYAIGQDGAAELKRIFVKETARGQGVGRRILEALEEAARLDGVSLMQLETGVKSDEALGLYRRFGYRDRGPFGTYQPDPLSVFMEKALAPTA